MAPALIDNAALLAELDSITEPPKTKGGVRCTVGVALSQMDPAAAAAVEAKLDSKQVTATAIAELLNRHGFNLRTPNLARHRRRGTPNGCTCPSSSKASA